MSPLLRPEDIVAREKALFVPDSDEVRAEYWKAFTDRKLAKVIAEKLVASYRFAYSLKNGDTTWTSTAVDSTTYRNPSFKGITLQMMQSFVDNRTTKANLEQAIAKQLALITEEPLELFTVKVQEGVTEYGHRYVRISMFISS